MLRISFVKVEIHSFLSDILPSLEFLKFLRYDSWVSHRQFLIKRYVQSMKLIKEIKSSYLEMKKTLFQSH